MTRRTEPRRPGPRRPGPRRPGPLRPALTALVLPALLLAPLAGCGEGSPTVPTGPESPAVASALTAPVPGVTLPPDPLRTLVPAPDEVPGGLVPVLTGSGRREAAAVAAYSADPTAAGAALAEHGFTGAYVAQYAEPAGSRLLSVVVVRFADAAGATADLAGDLAASAGEVVQGAAVGDASQLRRQPLPGQGSGELVTLRFRKGATTWLLAYGARPSAEPGVALRLGQLLAARA